MNNLIKTKKNKQDQQKAVESMNVETIWNSHLTEEDFETFTAANLTQWKTIVSGVDVIKGLKPMSNPTVLKTAVMTTFDELLSKAPQIEILAGEWTIKTPVDWKHSDWIMYSLHKHTKITIPLLVHYWQIKTQKILSASSLKRNFESFIEKTRNEMINTCNSKLLCSVYHLKNSSNFEEKIMSLKIDQLIWPAFDFLLSNIKGINKRSTKLESSMIILRHPFTVGFQEPDVLFYQHQIAIQKRLYMRYYYGIYFHHMLIVMWMIV